MNELRECPFCGGDAVKGEQYPFAVHCHQCDIATTGYIDISYAIAAWNRRATDADLDRLRELERAVRVFFTDDHLTIKQEDDVRAAIGRLLEGWDD